MPFGAVCACGKHEEWHHANQSDLRVASSYEEKFCTPDAKHGGRKRKICTCLPKSHSFGGKMSKINGQGK